MSETKVKPKLMEERSRIANDLFERYESAYWYRVPEVGRPPLPVTAWNARFISRTRKSRTVHP